MKDEQLLFKPDFFQKQIDGPGDLARINDLVDMRPAGKFAEEILIKDIFPSLPQQEVAAGLVDMEREKQALKLQQVLEKTLKPWVITPNLDGTPLPALTALELARATGLSTSKIINLVEESPVVIKSQGKTYQAIVEDVKLGLLINPKRIIKAARYKSRPPGGGPAQRIRFQKRRLPAQLERLARERTKIEFFPVDSQPEFPKNDAGRILNLRKSTELAVDPDIAEVIRYFREKGGKKWLRGTDEIEFARVLQELSNGRETDVLVWNCFDFDWIPAKKPGDYPRCVIKDTVDTSIVNYHSKRLAEALEYLALVGPIDPIVLTPSNEAFAQKWNYAQSRLEREQVVDVATDRLSILIKGAITTVPVTIMRFDEYLKSRGVIYSPEDLTNQGVNIFRRKLAEDPTLAKESVEDNREYFEQFGITIKDEEIEKFVAEYFGVYAGEGIGISKIVKSGQKVMVIDLEEGRVAKTTAEGARKAITDGTGEIFPIVSPLMPSEKFDFYQWKKEVIKVRKSKA